MPARTTQRESSRERTGTVAKAAARQARQQITERLGTEKSAMVREITGVAHALRAAAEQLDGSEQGAFAGYVERAAQATERLGEAIERQSFSDIVAQVERTCRERPLVAGAVAVGIGFLGARLARSAAAEGDAPTESGATQGSAGQKQGRAKRGAARSKGAA
jgi:ElaB/YqjD/DUF883 family membrane-anchored ribosome-binding protein